MMTLSSSASARLWLLVSILLSGYLLAAQNNTSRLVVTVGTASSGPFGGQSGLSCFAIYSDGEAFTFALSSEGVGSKDASGKVIHSEKQESRVYRFPEKDLWRIEGFADFLDSKAVRGLKAYYPPPHRPIDFVETTVVNWSPVKGQPKGMQVREYYVASLDEKAKYPSALIVLMDSIDQFETIVTEKGTPGAENPGCRLPEALSK
jgi:hypothetical protein